jgi:hypothetical protein
VKAVVIACLEPEHLDLSLDALLRWMPRDDVLVINNGNRPEQVRAIDDAGVRWGVDVGRTHDVLSGESTIDRIHEALKECAEMWAGETVLKVDEDVLLVSDPAAWDVGPGELLLPALTINNFTSRFFLRELAPELVAEPHPWLFHAEPLEGEPDLRHAAMRAIYGADPAVLVELCRRHGGVQRVGADDWEREALMVGPEGERRGISSTALAFRADDYLDLCGPGEGIEEVLLADAVWEGRAEYVVDTRIFAHHISYWPMRAFLEPHAAQVAAWSRRAISAAHAALPFQPALP